MITIVDKESMAQFKITRYFVVEAKNENEAVELLRNAENEEDECIETGEDVEKLPRKEWVIVDR